MAIRVSLCKTNSQMTPHVYKKKKEQHRRNDSKDDASRDMSFLSEVLGSVDGIAGRADCPKLSCHRSLHKPQPTPVVVTDTPEAEVPLLRWRSV